MTTEALVEAIYERDEGAVRAALDAGADPNALSTYGRTPLSVAVSGAGAEIVQLLLEAGADPNAEGECPLFAAAAFGMTDVLKLLIEHGADPNRADLSGETPILSASRGQLETAKALLDAGADPNAQGALVEATEWGYVGIVRLLLAHRARPDVADRWGRTALPIAKEWAGKNLEAEFRRQAAVAAPKGSEIVVTRDPTSDGTELVRLEARQSDGAMIWEGETGHAQIVELLRAATPR